jgi:acetyltransferase-like isoleucine patch superfamily enzyme
LFLLVLIATKFFGWFYLVLAKVIDNPETKLPDPVGSGVWIGAVAKIRSGVTIGDHAIIGAESQVNRDFAEWKVVAVMPARVVKVQRDAARTNRTVESPTR